MKSMFRLLSFRLYIAKVTDFCFVMQPILWLTAYDTVFVAKHLRNTYCLFVLCCYDSVCLRFVVIVYVYHLR